VNFVQTSGGVLSSSTAMLQESIEGATWEWCQKKGQGIYYDLKWGSYDMWRSVVWNRCTRISGEPEVSPFRIQVTVLELDP